MPESITLKEIRDLVGLRLPVELSSADVRRIRERLYTLAQMTPGRELSTELPPDWWADVAELEPILNEFRDVVEGLRLFRLLRPHADLWREFVQGD